MKVTCRYEIPKETYEYTNGDIGEHVANNIVRELCKKIADIIANGGEYIFRMTPNEIMENPYTNSLHYQRRVLYEPLMRCKDCRHRVFTKDGESNPHNIVCDYHMSDGFDETDFCSYGERRNP